MEYHTAYFWQEWEENLSSLALQQVYYNKKELPVVFACLGWSRQGRGRIEESAVSKPASGIVARLMDWFYGCGLQQCIKKGEKGIYRAGESLRRQLKNDRSEVALAGILGIGSRLCIFFTGEVSIRVLNLQDGEAHSKELRLAEKDSPGLGIQYAFMEPGVGVLLGTDGFWKGISGVCVEECLKGKALDGKLGPERRLRELGERGEQQGGTHMSAVLLVMG